MKSKIYLVLIFCVCALQSISQSKNPNIIIIYTDDLGYGDLSCYKATKIHTPNIDQLATGGIRFTNAHSTSATCTPSRYALLTGQYPWRKKGIEVLPGDAPLVIAKDQVTLASMLKSSGYKTAVVGKWHLGLGEATSKNWNEKISPGPNELGFDYSFIFPATADRVPTIFMENGLTVGLNPNDPIEVNYAKKIGNEPTGKENPELLKMKNSPNHGHDNTIVNGIGRIGFMSGGKTARWTDEELPLTFLDKSKEFIEENKNKPFFLFYALTEPHVPRMPSTVFKGKSGLGFRGDAILQIDWAVGEIVKQLKSLGIYNNTLIIFSSDNGPVLDDGYEDEAIEKLNGHTPWGVLRGGKYSSYEAGTRVPTILSWPAKVKGNQVSDALLCQVDWLASIGALIGKTSIKNKNLDSQNLLASWLGNNPKGRMNLIKQGRIPNAIIEGDWKLIVGNKGATMSKLTNIELGNNPEHQLFNLKTDLSEKINLASKHPEKVEELLMKLKQEIGEGFE